MKVVLLVLLPAVAWALVCPDGGICEDNSTCCLLRSGDYGCCSFLNAVCCDDRVHCCSQGSVCQQGQCYQIPSTSMNQTKDIVCPGGKYSCPEGNTCCPVGSAFSCCPLPDANCCSDGLHCCPSGTTCDLAHETCNVPAQSAASSAVHSSLHLQVVVCPGGEFQCPDGNTCCLLASGEYGCCPLPDAVCCDDQVHCCPTGTYCKDGACSPDLAAVPISTVVPELHIREINSVLCPDQSECPNGNTCCQLSTGRYGCCPMANATCCPDRIHCCPSGSQCDPTRGSCVSSSTHNSVPFQRVSKEVALKMDDPVVCPDEKSACPADNTCCQLTSGQYGCCPLPDAVCCLDMLHCCPEGTQCDATTGGCVQRSRNLEEPRVVVPWSRKTAARRRDPDSLNEI